MDQGGLLTIAEAAARYRVGRSTLYAMVQRRELPHYARSIGKVRVLLDAAEVEKALGMRKVDVQEKQATTRSTRPAAGWRAEWRELAKAR